MKRIWFLPILFLFAGCGGGGSGGKIAAKSTPTAVSVSVSAPSNRANTVSQVKLIVNGPEIKSVIMVDLELDSGSGVWQKTLEIPSGIDREFTATAIDPRDLPVFVGSTKLDIKPGVINKVEISMREPEPTPEMFNDPIAVQSPSGSVGLLQKAYSPDGTRYLMQVEPAYTGQLGIFDKTTDGLLVQFSALPTGFTNDVKGMCWSHDSKYIAISYHGGMRPGVSLYRASDGKFLRTIGWAFHLMIFSPDDTWIYTSWWEKDPSLDRFPSTIGRTGDDFALLCGANYPWINYGWDIGKSPWGGADGGFSTNVARLNSDFAYCAANEIRLVRVFIFCDLRTGIVFGPDGIPQSFDDKAMADFDALVQAAKANGIKLLPVLFDYTLADSVSMEGANKVGEHPEVITDSAKQAALIEILRPLFAKYGSDPTIYGWDIVNEPDLAIAVSASQIRNFVAKLTMAIHSESPSAVVTVGLRNRGELSSWTGVGLNLYQFHYYDSMETEFPWNVALSMDKPILIGEAQPSNVTQKLTQAQGNGYAGVLFWSLNADYDFRAVVPDFAAFIRSLK